LYERATLFCYIYVVCLLVTDFGVKVKEFVNKGHLVPDRLMIALITSELRLLENNNWLLDGK
jgi:adenylate kinase family enzyme